MIASTNRVPQPPDQSVAVPTDPIWRLSVTQYHEMIRSGILTEADPVELLEGWLVTKMAKNPRHTLATQLTSDAINAVLPSGWFINVQEPITTLDSEPEPDLAIIRGMRRDYADRHPHPNEIELVIEVADTSLQRDRTSKMRLYAFAEIPTYWIINLPEQRIEVYSLPKSEAGNAGYQKQAYYSELDTVALVIQGQEITRFTVRDLLG